MEALRDWHDVQRLTACVPRTSTDHSVSLYAGKAQIEHWCAQKDLRALVSDGAVLILRSDGDFERVYHVARDVVSLTDALKLLPNGRYVADLIGRDQPLDRLSSAYMSAGFAEHTFLRRMTRARSAGLLPDENGVELAGVAHAEEVASFLDRLLDRMSEQVPDLDELRTAAGDGRLLIVRRNAAVAGMLMYDRQGQLAHLRFWHVDPAEQGHGIGRRLMASFLSRCEDASRIVLWVIGDNDRSIAIYRHYGFQLEGLLDRIMVANKDEKR